MPTSAWWQGEAVPFGLFFWGARSPFLEVPEHIASHTLLARVGLCANSCTSHWPEMGRMVGT